MRFFLISLWWLGVLTLVTAVNENLGLALLGVVVLWLGVVMPLPSGRKGKK